MTIPDGRVGHAELVVDADVIADGARDGGNSGDRRPTATQYAHMTSVFLADVDAADDTAAMLGGPLVGAQTDMRWVCARRLSPTPKDTFGS